jgi:hypothetical protein
MLRDSLAEQLLQRLENRCRQPDRKNPRKHRHYEKLNSQPSSHGFRPGKTKTLDFAFLIYLYDPSLKIGTLHVRAATESDPKSPFLVLKRRVEAKVKPNVDKKSAAPSGYVFRNFPLSTAL